MIFSLAYDRALWLILAGDKKNREKLVYFIKTMPREIYEDICKMISSNISSGVVISECVNLISNTMQDENGFKYLYSFGIYFGTLQIKVNRYNEDVNLSESFILELKQINENNINNMNVGSFTWSCDKIYYNLASVTSKRKGAKVNYNIRLGCFNKMVLTSRENKSSYRNKVVNYYRDCPNNIYLSDFNSSDNVNNLIRKRKR